MKEGRVSNGSGSFKIDWDDRGGWVRVYGVNLPDPLPEALPLGLSDSLTEFFRQHPRLGMTGVASIVVDGRTVELHAWYEVRAVPPHASKPHKAGPS